MEALEQVVWPEQALQLCGQEALRACSRDRDFLGRYPVLVILGTLSLVERDLVIYRDQWGVARSAESTE